MTKTKYTKIKDSGVYKMIALDSKECIVKPKTYYVHGFPCFVYKKRGGTKYFIIEESTGKSLSYFYEWADLQKEINFIESSVTKEVMDQAIKSEINNGI